MRGLGGLSTFHVVSLNLMHQRSLIAVPMVSSRRSMQNGIIALVSHSVLGMKQRSDSAGENLTCGESMVNVSPETVRSSVWRARGCLKESFIHMLS